MIPQWWLDVLVEGLSGHDLRRWPDEVGSPGEIEYVITLKPEPNSLSNYPNLRAIFSTAAGIDHFIFDKTLPKGVPICRFSHPELASRMSEYILLNILRFHRQLPAYQEQQKAKLWKPLQQKAAQDVTVGVMGIGNLGLDSAQKLLSVGFNVRGWSRTPKIAQGIECFHGQAQLEGFLAGADYLACFLPLTPETKGILNARAFSSLPQGAVIINVGRGACIVEKDLLDGLSTGSIGAAVLDVFETEPLPPEHPFWVHPNILITPHISTVTHPRMLVPNIQDNIARIESGRPPTNVVDATRGY